MIASVYRLNRADWKALDIKDAYSLHKTVYSLFPKQNGQVRDFLYADKGGDWNCRQVLMLSERRPEHPEIGEIESKEIPESFLQWGNYGFEVTINPVQRNGPSKKTTPIKGRKNLHKWFIQKAPTWGFDVEPESLQISKIGVVSFNREKGTRQTHGTATFIGKLKVIDKETYINSFKCGIGRAKGFGFGLLQIVPVQKH
ncbi:MAG: type I-E CRISPR-associated protein Cas6/Cse3/CasE [Candidatus Brocadiaceae bacterium]|nr:type I-E CRISPR-associated protein Cas6/Cse3/CasE [Candidatus Brocadiaceae bacterium]